jgi:hypothetical protein
VTNQDVLNCLMTEKQLVIYTKSCMNILKFVDLSESQYQKTPLPNIISLLNVRCQRSFVFCLCLFIVFTKEDAESYTDAFPGGLVDIETMTRQCTCIMLHSMDNDFVKHRADHFMRLLRTCLDSGQHLCCTVKKSADSAMCACGVKISTKPLSKTHAKLYKSALARCEATIQGVRIIF